MSRMKKTARACWMFCSLTRAIRHKYCPSVGLLEQARTPLIVLVLKQVMQSPSARQSLRPGVVSPLSLIACAVVLIKRASFWL